MDPIRYVEERRRLLDRLPGRRRRPARPRPRARLGLQLPARAGSGRRWRASTTGLAGIGRLILFDKRGTGLSDRVHGHRLARGAHGRRAGGHGRRRLRARGAPRRLRGRADGGAVRRHPPGAHGRARSRWAVRARSWAPDYPIGRREQQDDVAAPTPEQWGRSPRGASSRSARRRSPATRRRSAGTPPTSSAARAPTAVAQITRMNDEIDVRHVLPTVHVPTLVLYRARRVPARARALHGRAHARARGWSALPGADHLPWEGEQEDVLDEIEALPDRRRRDAASPRPCSTTVLDAERAAAFDAAAWSPASAARRCPSPAGRVRATLRRARRAPSAARRRSPRRPELRAGVHTGECEPATAGARPGAGDRGERGRAAAAAGRDARHLDRARPRGALRDRFEERGGALPLAAHRASGGCSPSCGRPPDYRAFTGRLPEANRRAVTYRP